MKSITNRITMASKWLQIHLRDFHTDVQHSQKYTFHFDPSNDTLIEFRSRREIFIVAEDTMVLITWACFHVMLERWLVVVL